MCPPRDGRSDASFARRLTLSATREEERHEPFDGFGAESLGKHHADFVSVTRTSPLTST